MEDYKNWLMYGGIGLALIGFVALVAFGASNSSDDNNNPTVAQVTADDWTQGPEDAPVTLIEYGDLECPACKSYHPVVKQVLEDQGEDVQFAFRHFPLSMHRHARVAAQAAEAAGMQDSFWEMVDILFENQGEWSAMSDPEDAFINYAESLELDAEQFRQDMNSNEARLAVNSDLESGQQAGVSATPTFYVNGQKISTPRSASELNQVINQAKN